MPLLIIDIRDLVDVIKELLSPTNQFCYSDWYQLGLYLGLHGNTLDAINEDHKNSKHCFIACISAWLRGEDKVKDEGGASWLSLVVALDKMGAYHNIVTNIKDNYNILEHSVSVASGSERQERRKLLGK